MSNFCAPLRLFAFFPCPLEVKFARALNLMHKLALLILARDWPTLDKLANNVLPERPHSRRGRPIVNSFA